MSGKPIYLDNDDEPEYFVGRKNLASRVDEPVSGLADLYVHWSLTDGGTAVDASLRKLTAERTAAPGFYFARMEGSDARTHLATVRGVYEVFGDGVNIYSSVYRRVFERRRPA